MRALRTSVAEGREGQAYLFSGPRGTGKTTTARIMAKVLNCENPQDGEPCCECESCLAVERGVSYDVHELDAASNNGVDAMRDLIEKASLGTPGRHKVYILDEVHMLSKAAEAALLKTLEEPPAHVVFVLATTDPQKVLAHHPQPHPALCASTCCRRTCSPNTSSGSPPMPASTSPPQPSPPPSRRVPARPATRCRRSTRLVANRAAAPPRGEVAPRRLRRGDDRPRPRRGALAAVVARRELATPAATREGSPRSSSRTCATGSSRLMAPELVQLPSRRLARPRRPGERLGAAEPRARPSRCSARRWSRCAMRPTRGSLLDVALVQLTYGAADGAAVGAPRSPNRTPRAPARRPAPPPPSRPPSPPPPPRRADRRAAPAGRSNAPAATTRLGARAARAPRAGVQSAVAPEPAAAAPSPVGPPETTPAPVDDAPSRSRWVRTEPRRPTRLSSRRPTGVPSTPPSDWDDRSAECAGWPRRRADTARSCRIDAGQRPRSRCPTAVERTCEQHRSPARCRSRRWPLLGRRPRDRVDGVEGRGGPSGPTWRRRRRQHRRCRMRAVELDRAVAPSGPVRPLDRLR